MVQRSIQFVPNISNVDTWVALGDVNVDVGEQRRCDLLERRAVDGPIHAGAQGEQKGDYHDRVWILAYVRRANSVGRARVVLDVDRKSVV